MLSSPKHYWTGLVIMLTLVNVGCSGTKASTKPGMVHTVNVGQQIDPLQMNAAKGDEIRWVNNTTQPISVIFPKAELLRTSCRTGFAGSDQTVLSAVLPPDSSASLCFSQPGKYDYQVRLNENSPGARMDRTASVWVGGSGHRNPGPVEQFENIAP
ncbi:conserved exported protein of unknown function [Nitrospira sp. KM1]|uniref:hypothetical protein n=1 Tax=Nitrospira sp. KM1 TaxID=1936990 RepID=UPI0013A78EED|nr:hypothetical protein [Nitrospira sp. KM1]BCA54505.1 conserved exported protein of unknown function [Nitrospira sp. KM1]